MSADLVMSFPPSLEVAAEAPAPPRARPRPSREDVRDARRYVHDRLGGMLEGKATDTLCLALARGLRGGLESGGGRALPRELVLECGGASPELRRPAVAEGEVLRRPAAASSLVAPVAERREPREARRARLAAAREAFEAEFRDVVARLERAAVESYGAPAEAVEGREWSAGARTLACWLNRTVYTGLIPTAMAEVADATGVERLDLPGVARLEMLDAGAAIRLPQFRTRLDRTGKGVRVGLFDNEVWTGHRALAGRVVPHAQMTDEPWGHPGLHGTAVAGIIAADDGRGNAGIAPGCTVYNYKLFSAGKHAHNRELAIAGAFLQAIDDEIQVLNCSFGFAPGTNVARRMTDACDTAWEAGVAVVKSAGNDGPGAGTLTSPAEASGVIVVGATDRFGRNVQTYSSRGPVGRSGVHLVAPGGARTDPLAVCRPRGGIRASSKTYGTSFAAPHVTGVLALMLETEPALEPDDLRDRLLALCVPIPGEAPEAQGAGLLSLDAFT